MANSNLDGTAARSGATTVFVSYSRNDQKRALPIIKILEDAGFSVWWDGLLEGGERFSQTTEAALESAKAVVVLWSATSNGSHWVHDEATRGRDRNVLVPLSIDGSEAPLGFRQFQVIDAKPAKMRSGSTETQAMLRAVAALHNRPMHFAGPPNRRSFNIDRRALLWGSGVVAVAGVGSAAAWQSGLFDAARAANSVAVLPFRNLSGDSAQDYFSDGLAEEIRATLSRNPLLQVAAPASAGKFREGSEVIQKIARQLGVAYVLGGSVRRSGKRVRIVADLIDGRTGMMNWTRSFEKDFDDILAIQDDIAQTVTGVLSAQINGRGVAKERTAAGGTDNPAAFDSYLQGKALYEQGTDDTSDVAALAKLDGAIALDSGYASAYAVRARVLTTIANGTSSQDISLQTRYATALFSARRAVKLAPNSADAQSTLGAVFFQGLLDVKSAKEPFYQSRKLGNGDAAVMARFALYQARTGHFNDASTAIARALVLDPLNPLIFRASGLISYAARRFADAISPLRQALSMSPKMASAHDGIGSALFQMGEIPEARAEFEAEPEALRRFAGLAIVAHKTGDRVAAKLALDALIADSGDTSLYQQSQIYAQWGEREIALETLQRAYKFGDSGLIFMRNDPMLDPIRKDPQFIRLLKTIGFD
jgi:TolB-like protein/tetratricopeptide (TPR) repeat protein